VEKLRVKNLGPIKDFEMTTNRLTVLIGPQASGKSLLAQMLYFFNEFKAIFSERFPYSSVGAEWEDEVVVKLLSDMRGAPICSFMCEDSDIVFGRSGEEPIGLRGFCKVSTAFKEMVGRLNSKWSDSSQLLIVDGKFSSVFIPTERSFYTRLINTRQSALFSEEQSYLMRKFSEDLEYCGKNYAVETDQDEVIESQQVKALGGRVKRVVGGLPPRTFWAWDLTDEKDDRFPLAGISSGQMESWPFFALCKVFGGDGLSTYFYFEEPETHLHPSAQVEVVKTIAYLISRGHRFVITTHSPFILYVINNLIQAHIAYEGNPPEGEFSINPDHVAAYCLGDNPRSIVKEDTKLLELREIDSVFDKLNADFERYLDMEFARGGK
jgi:hypothetical protein